MSSHVADDGAAPELLRVRRAIVMVDMVESVRLMHAFEADVIDRWRRFLAEVRSAVLPRFQGRLVKSLGDGMLLEFGSVHRAAAAAFELQRCIARYNNNRAADAAILLRTGAHIADVVVDELDIYGPGVNTAARVAAAAAPNDILCTVQFRDELVAGIDAELQDLGEIYVKHLEDALHCWRIVPPLGLAAVSSAPAAPAAQPTKGTPNVQVPRIAIMPLVGVQLSAADAAAGALIADSLTARLARGSVLRVISRLSTAALAGRACTAPEIAQRLSVQYVVAGSVTGRGRGRWRVNLELADGADGAVLWTRSSDVQSAAVLQPDDDLTAELAASLIDAIASHQLLRLATHALPSLQSYALQLAGLRLMHRADVGDFERARTVLETLVDRHPRAPVPRAWLAQWWVLRTTRGLAGTPRDEAAQALSHTRSALHTDPDCALALATQGFVECHMLRDLDAAEHTLERAIAASANEPLAWLYRSVVHGFRGEGEQAYRAAETASALSPLDPQRHYFDALTASAAITAGALPRGIELARRALQVNRNHLPTLRALTVALAESGDLPAAQEAGRQVMGLTPFFTINDYLCSAPKGSEPTRQRFAAAFSLAGLPMG